MSAGRDSGALLPTDANRHPIQKARVIQCEDGGPSDGSPQEPQFFSPVVLSSTASTRFIVPAAATELVIHCGGAVRIGRNESMSAGVRNRNYFLVPAGVVMYFPVWGMESIYLRRDDADGSPQEHLLFFYFESLKQR